MASAYEIETVLERFSMSASDFFMIMAPHYDLDEPRTNVLITWLIVGRKRRFLRVSVVSRNAILNMSPRNHLMCNRPEEEDEDDKLYCLCQQKYVEGEVMLACEKCDEWYHPKCLGISEEEADKLDNWMCSRFFPVHLFHPICH